MTYTDRARAMLAAAVRDGKINELRAEWPQASIQALSAASGVSMREIIRRIDSPTISLYTLPDLVESWPTPHAWRFIAALADRWPVLDLLDLYWEILGRAPDSDGFAYWRERLLDVGILRIEAEFREGISDEDRERLDR